MNITAYIKSRPLRLAIALFIICTMMRLVLAKRHGIWADEAFSLAMATGHSIEQPASVADPTKGDFIELSDAATPREYGKYLWHDDPAASPARVVRAVFLSDTSPPLYYLLLYGWTRMLGTGDYSLRLFTVFFALACFPLIYWLGKQVGGSRTAIAACTLYTFLPTPLYYGTEGRMYSLLWFFTLCAMCLTYQLNKRGASASVLMLWVLSAAAGLMTHYFFAFVLMALGGWLMIFPGRASRIAVIVGAILIGALVAPWYLQVPATLTHWRVTDYWLTLLPYQFSRLKDTINLPWNYFTVAMREVRQQPKWVDSLNAAAFATVFVVAIFCLKRRLFTPRRLMLMFCMAAACAGLYIFDFWRKTYVVDCPRYASAGLPAAMLFGGFAIARIPKLPRRILLTFIVIFSMAADGILMKNDTRIHALRQTAGAVCFFAKDGDIVIVSSIPSGVAGIARYMQPLRGREPVFASWVEQLGTRKTPDDILHLARGRKRILLVRIHEVWAEPKHEEWLTQHATLANTYKYMDAQLEIFEPLSGETF